MFKKQTEMGIPSSKIHSLALEILNCSLTQAQEMPKRAVNKFSEEQQVGTFELWSTLLVLILSVQLRSIFDVPTSNNILDLILEDYYLDVLLELKFSEHHTAILMGRLADNIVHYGEFTKQLFPDGEGNVSGTLVSEISVALSDLLNYPRAHVEVPVYAVNDASRLVKILKNT